MNKKNSFLIAMFVHNNLHRLKWKMDYYKEPLKMV
jgi:hypothetical protein